MVKPPTPIQPLMVVRQKVPFEFVKMARERRRKTFDFLAPPPPKKTTNNNESGGSDESGDQQQEVRISLSGFFSATTTTTTSGGDSDKGGGGGGGIKRSAQEAFFGMTREKVVDAIIQAEKGCDQTLADYIPFAKKGFNVYDVQGVRRVWGDFTELKFQMLMRSQGFEVESTTLAENKFQHTDFKIKGLTTTKTKEPIINVDVKGLRFPGDQRNRHKTVIEINVYENLPGIVRVADPSLYIAFDLVDPHRFVFISIANLRLLLKENGIDINQPTTLVAGYQGAIGKKYFIVTSKVKTRGDLFVVCETADIESHSDLVVPYDAQKLVPLAVDQLMQVRGAQDAESQKRQKTILN